MKIWESLKSRGLHNVGIHGESVMVELTSRAKMPKPRGHKTAVKERARHKRLIDAYCKEYRRVHGCSIVVTFESGYYRITGRTEGVSAKRLGEMTTQLRNRQSAGNE
jgi:hypothetical protein